MVDEPLRTCIGCRTVRPQHELNRFVRNDDGTVVAGRRSPGRGAWLCRNSSACLAEAKHRKAFDRSFRRPCKPLLTD